MRDGFHSHHSGNGSQPPSCPRVATQAHLPNMTTTPTHYGLEQLLTLAALSDYGQASNRSHLSFHWAIRSTSIAWCVDFGDRARRPPWLAR